MNEIFQSIILGIAQGLGEFLPISSTAHLVIAPYFFGWKDPGLAFDVALHIGTLIAVLAYFWKDWINIFKLALKNNFQFPISNFQINPKSQAPEHQNSDYVLYSDRSIVHNKNLFWFLVVATIPGVLVGYFLEEKAETVFRNPVVIALTLAIFGLILCLVDKYVQHRKNIGEVSLKDSIIIGLSQAIAIIPGVSRSGATITAGLLTGLDRVGAARFSFLLSTPIIFGAAVFKIPHLIQEGINIPIIIGVIASAASGYLAIKYLLRFVEKASYAVFFWYRLVLAAVILVIYSLE